MGSAPAVPRRPLGVRAGAPSAVAAGAWRRTRSSRGSHDPPGRAGKPSTGRRGPVSTHTLDGRRSPVNIGAPLPDMGAGTSLTTLAARAGNRAMCSWRAGCGGSRKSGSEGGGEETPGRKAGTGASPPTLREDARSEDARKRSTGDSPLLRVQRERLRSALTAVVGVGRLAAGPAHCCKSRSMPPSARPHRREVQRTPTRGDLRFAQAGSRLLPGRPTRRVRAM